MKHFSSNGVDFESLFVVVEGSEGIWMGAGVVASRFSDFLWVLFMRPSLMFLVDFCLETDFGFWSEVFLVN